MIKIVHLITGLNNGGAETMLCKLLSEMDTKLFDIEVISMTDRGTLADKIEAIGMKVHTLDMKRGFPSLKSLLKAIKICKRVDVIQTWMYHADFLGFLIHLFNPKAKLIWGIRHGNLDADKNKRMTLMIAKINSYLSHFVNVIVSCSQNAIDTHVAYGYSRDKCIFIPNGFKIDEFYKRNNIDSELNFLTQDMGQTFKICTVGRWDIQKDYETLIKALSILIEKHLDVTLIMVGTNLDKENVVLMSLLKEYAVMDNTVLMGRRNDIAELMSMCSIYVSSSAGEGFSNVIGEAMACELPCVVTNVGDSAYIVKETGYVVEPQNPKVLADAIGKMIIMNNEERNDLGKKARRRIVENFEINLVAKKFENLYL